MGVFCKATALPENNKAIGYLHAKMRDETAGIMKLPWIVPDDGQDS